MQGCDGARSDGGYGSAGLVSGQSSDSSRTSLESSSDATPPVSGWDGDNGSGQTGGSNGENGEPASDVDKAPVMEKEGAKSGVEQVNLSLFIC